MLNLGATLDRNARGCIMSVLPRVLRPRAASQVSVMGGCMLGCISMLLKAATVAALLAATSAFSTVVFSTSFPGNAVPNGLVSSNASGFHLAVSGGVATFSKDEASNIPGSVPRNGAASLSTDFQVAGDFDISVDLAIGTLGRVGQAGLSVSFQNGGAGLYVEGPGGESGLQSLVHYTAANNCAPNFQGCGSGRLFSAGGTAWRLRIQRVATTIYIYAATAQYPQWALYRYATGAALTAPVTVSMFLQQASNSTSAHQVAFDNFLVTAGSFYSTKRSYAALGDSYSSGEGLLPYRDPGDLPLSGCHRSTRAYPALIRWPGSVAAISQSNDSIFDFIACSGAVTDNVRADGEGQNGEPPQMDPGNAIDSRRDLVTISIGGNDAQFARIFAYCMAHPDCNNVKPFSPKSEVTLGDLAPLLVAYAGTKVVDIHARLRAAAPSANILVLGYPILLSGKECPAAQFPPFGASDLKLSASEQNFLRGMNRLLNEVIATSATLSGLHFIDVEQRFTGHEVCGDLDDWVNGVVLFDPNFNPKASVHPTARGQQEYANAVNEFLVANSASGVNAGQLASTRPRNASSATATGRLSALLESAPAVLPEMGELRVSLAAVPVGCDRLDNVLVPGQGARLRGEGFLAHEAVSLSIVLSGVRITLGTVAADANGLLDTLVSIPIEVPTGRVLSVEALGSGVKGAGRLLINISRVETSASLDNDGDGIPDLCDNCSAKPNPDQLDTDHDGYGNVCDADFDNNGIVNTLDLAILKATFGQRGDDKATDLDGNFIVNTFDLAIFKGLFGKRPGPAFNRPGAN